MQIYTIIANKKIYGKNFKSEIIQFTDANITLNTYLIN